MSILTTIFRFLRRGLLWLLLIYWAIFIGYTAVKLFRGGPSAVVVWYRHMARATFHWNWGTFLAQHSAILAVTLALCFLEWRPAIQKAGVPRLE